MQGKKKLKYVSKVHLHSTPESMNRFRYFSLLMFFEAAYNYQRKYDKIKNDSRPCP